MAVAKKSGDAGQAAGAAKPALFFSYSTAEPTHYLLSTLIWIVFHNDYTLQFTLSSLTSGQSQLKEIERQIRECTFAVVCLDGLRPNVIHEYGYMRGIDKPVILLKEKNATVDVRHFLGTSGLEASNPANPPLLMDSHLSNLKEVVSASYRDRGCSDSRLHRSKLTEYACASLLGK